MSVTDQQIFDNVQSLLAESIDSGATWSSGMWTVAEMLEYLNDRQQRAIAELGAVVKRTTISCNPHLLRQELPGDWIATLRLVWVRASDSRHFVLERSDLWDLDSAKSNWRVDPGIPEVYDDADQPTRTVMIVPAPSAAGTLKLTYLGLPTAFTGSGVASDLPDELAATLLPWGVVEDALSKEGRAKDPRAAVAGAQAGLAAEAVKLLLLGLG